MKMSPTSIFLSLLPSPLPMLAPFNSLWSTLVTFTSTGSVPSVFSSGVSSNRCRGIALPQE